MLKVRRQQPRRPELLANPPQHLERNLLSNPLLLYLGVQAPILVQLLVRLANSSTSHRPRILVTYSGVVPLVNHSSSSSHNINKMCLEVEMRSGNPINSRPTLLAEERQFLVILHPNPRSPLSVEVRIYSSR